MIELFRLQSIVERKSALFSLIVTGIVAILVIFVIMPPILHGFHIVYIFLHMVGIMLAVFITILATLAFRKLKTKRLLLNTIGFRNFIGTETYRCNTTL